MKAVIVAAGRATRLRPHSREKPKCLFEVDAEVTLLDYILTQLKRFGVQDIVIVTRPEYVGQIFERVGEEAKIVTVTEDDYGNLYSFYIGAKSIEFDDKILALMSDHLFEPEILRRLVETEEDKGVVLCLDKEPGWKDLGEGLRIYGEEDVKAAGKKLKRFTGVDTGLFLLNKEGVKLVERVVERIGPSAKFVDLVNYAAERGEAAYVDVSGRIWIDIDTPEDLVRARKLYPEIVRRSLIKSTDGPVSIYINRPISTRVSLFIYKHVPWLGPNQLSILSFIIGTFSAISFLTGHPITGGALAQLSSIMDGVDGEIARLREQVTEFGGFFDTVLDRFMDIFVIISLGIYALNYLPFIWIFTLTSLAASGVVMVSYISAFSKKLLDQEKLRRGFPWATRDVRLFTVMIGGLLQQPLIPLIFCAVAPQLFAVKALLLSVVKRAEVKPRLPVLRPPIPEMDLKPKRRIGEVKSNIISLISNSVKLVITISAINFLLPIFGDIPLPTIWFTEIKISHVLTLLNLVGIIYFGYKILMALKFFVDAAAEHMVRALEVTRRIYMRVTMDLLYMIAIIIIWLAVSPFLSSLAQEFKVLKISSDLLFLAIFSIILYDFLKISYKSLRGVWERFLEKISESLEKR